MPMDDLPLTVFEAEDGRDAERDGSDLVCRAEPGTRRLDLEHVRQVFAHELRDRFKAARLAVADLRCSTVDRRVDLLPAANRWPNGVRQRHVVAPRPHGLLVLGVSLHE